jgi:hypothetical protein
LENGGIIVCAFSMEVAKIYALIFALASTCMSVSPQEKNWTTAEWSRAEFDSGLLYFIGLHVPRLLKLDINNRHFK